MYKTYKKILNSVVIVSLLLFRPDSDIYTPYGWLTEKGADSLKIEYHHHRIDFTKFES